MTIPKADVTSGTGGDVNELYPFQQQGVEFLLAAPHRLLADEMGLGKSVQACAALTTCSAKWILIICPAILKETWAEYVYTWTPFAKDSIQIVNSTTDKLEARYITIVNYECLLAMPGAKEQEKNKARGKANRKRASEVAKQLALRSFDIVIVDECQRLKSIRSSISKLMLAQVGKRDPLVAAAKRKWFLTGTPMPNRPIELFPMLRTLAPEVLGAYQDYDDFGNRYCSGYWDGFQNNYSGASNVSELKDRLQSFMLRREVKDVFSELPEKVVHPIYCQLPPLGVSKADTPLATLRQITGLAKVPFSAEFIRGILEDEPETKIVAFAYSRAVIEALADCPLLERFNPVFIYGGLTQADKQFALRHFKDDSRCRLIILQIKAAGEGIDGLQNVSNVVVFPELEWSAGTFDQAVARLDRIGQKSVVRIYPIIAKNTLDESIIGSYHKKSRTIRQLFDNTTEGSKHMAIEDELKTIAVSLKELCSIVSNVLGEAQKVADQKKTVADLDKQKETKAASKPATKPADKPKDNVVKMAEPSSKEEEMRALMLKVVRACPEGKDAGKKDIAAVLSACGVKPPKSDAVTADQQEAVIQGLEKKLMIYSAPPAEESDDLDAV